MTTGTITITVGGERHEVQVPNVERITAAQLNALMQLQGVDVAMVTAVTPGHELIDRLRGAELEAKHARDRATEAERRDDAWRTWWAEMRDRFTGMYRMGADGKKRAVNWGHVEVALPWPSLEDEREEGWEDE
jgi:hypothetical protein